MNNRNETRRVFAVIIGFVLGAVVGGFIAAFLGLALLTLYMKWAHASSDSATGVGSFILLLTTPLGLIIGGSLGSKLANNYFSSPESK